MADARQNGGPGARIKAGLGRILVQASLLRAGARCSGLGRVWQYTDDCAGLGRLPPADPRQNPRHVLPGLAARPWDETTSRADWVMDLEAQAASIRETLARESHSGFADVTGDLVPEPWRVHFLRCLGADIERSFWPAATAAVRRVPRKASTGHAFLAQLDPGTETALVTGNTNTRRRVLLGIEVPTRTGDDDGSAPTSGREPQADGAVGDGSRGPQADGAVGDGSREPQADGVVGACGLEVAGEARPLRAGRALLFDDSFPHRAWNRSARPLVVLVVDVWHPGIDDHEAVALESFMRLSPKSERDRRVVQDGLGRRRSSPLAPEARAR